MYQQWSAGKHFGANVGSYECHRAGEGDAAFEHGGYLITVIVSPSAGQGMMMSALAASSSTTYQLVMKGTHS